LVNIKVMKKILFSLILTCIHLVCFSQIEDTVFPNPIGYTSDFEKIFAAKQINELDSLIIDFEKNTSNEIAIITVDNIGNYSDFNKYALDLSNKWGVGKAGKDNGLTIVFCNKMRQIRINTGTQTGHILTDEICNRILQEIILPSFRKGDYFEGIKNGLKELIVNWK